MGAYFQYIAFSMESTKAPFFFTPIYQDAGGLGNMTTVAAPVFVRPSCTNGEAAGEQLLLGVVGKDVTLAELKESGLNRAQVEVMIDESLGNARACNEAYRYTDCKMQTPLTSAQPGKAARSWVVDSPS
eukprot:evm.model.scf_348EXC.1 EVM.evm.TU.scf_348EXC.1   scf_348EXC:11917-13911(+)